MSEVLSLIGKAWRQDPREIAADYFRASIDGEKHYRMVAVCGALILRRFTDDEIVSALEPAYRAIVHNDPSMSRLRVCPPSACARPAPAACDRALNKHRHHCLNSTNGLAPTGRFAMPRKFISKLKPHPMQITFGLDAEWEFNVRRLASMICCLTKRSFTTRTLG